MAYLSINGYAIKTREGGEVSFEEISPNRSYSFNGSYQFSRNAVGRSWRYTTIPLPKNEALALIGLLNQQGDHWRFDVAAASRPVVAGSLTNAAYWSDKRRHGYSTSASTAPVASAEACFGADGALVYDLNGVAQRPWAGATGFVLCEPGATN